MSLAWLTGALIFLTGQVFAACAGPAGNAGDQVYNTTYSIMQFCNGTSWISMASAASGAGFDNLGNHTATQNLDMSGFSVINALNGTYSGAVTAASLNGTNISGTLIQAGASGASCISGINGAIRYNATSNTLQVCVGTAWTSLSSGTSAGVGTLASLTDVTVTSPADNDLLQYSTGSSKWVNVSANSLIPSADRITSGTLSIIANTGSTYASLTTNGTTWGYLSSNASFIPQLQVNNLNAGNVSGTLVQTGSSSATCGISLYGTIRWNATSDTIQICNTGGWTSVASSSVPNTTTSQGQNNYAAIFSGPNTLVTDSALYVDRTNHRVGIGTDAPSNTLTVSTTTNPLALFVTNGDAVNPVIQLKDNSPAQGRSGSINFLNGAGLSMGQLAYATGYNYMRLTTSGTERMRIVSTGEVGISNTSPIAKLDVVGTISASDAIQVGASALTCAAGINGAIRYNTTSNTLQVCVGTAWTSLSSDTTAGGGTPGGATTQVQYNNNGVFAADAGLTYTSGTQVLTASTVSGTYHYGQYGSFTTIYNAGSFAGNTISANSVSSSLVSATNVSVTIAHFNVVSGAAVSGYGGNAISSGTTYVSVSSTGVVGIGGSVDVSGSLATRAYNAGAGTSFDWSRSNSQYTSANCGAMTFSNMADGGVYQLVITGTTGTCSFTHSGLTVKMPSGHTAVTGASVYTFLRVGANLFVTYMSGY